MIYSPYFDYQFVTQDRLAIVRWFLPSDLTEKEFHGIVEDYFSLVKRDEPHFILNDGRKNHFILYASINKESFDKALEVYSQTGLKKLALLSSADPVDYLPFENVVTHYVDQSFKIRHYLKEADALNWLKGKKRDLAA